MESILFHHIMGSTALWFSWFLGYQKLCLNQNSEITFTNPMYPLLYFITRWELFRVLEKLFVAAFAEAPILKFKHCQRHNGPEGWVHITESRSSINFKISTKHQHLDYKAKVKILTKPSFRILTKIHLRNINQTPAAKHWPNFSFKILPELQL